MAEYKISVDLAGIAASVRAAVDQRVFPLLAQAVFAVVQQTRIDWMEAVQRAKLWSGEKTAYSASIKMEMTGPFAGVVWSDYKYAEDIETGRPPYDLKKMLDTSTKVRRTKDGRRFLVIPFRHNTPGNDALAPSMPQAVYQSASLLEPSRIVAQTKRRSGEITTMSKGAGMQPAARQTPFLSDPKRRNAYTGKGMNFMVNRNIYQWGGRLETDDKRYQGMVRFDTGRKGARHSTFMTFRIMMEGQTGWIIPARPGLYLAKKVADDMQPLAEKAFGEAIKRSLD